MKLGTFLAFRAMWTEFRAMRTGIRVMRTGFRAMVDGVPSDWTTIYGSGEPIYPDRVTADFWKACA
jgi:hypothetical protein